jgi:hypothetical protein
MAENSSKSTKTHLAQPGCAGRMALGQIWGARVPQASPVASATAADWLLLGCQPGVLAMGASAPGVAVAT